MDKQATLFDQDVNCDKRANFHQERANDYEERVNDYQARANVHQA